MRKENLLFYLICICSIAFWFISCAPSAENATSFNSNYGNNIFRGIYHGAIIPFSVIGKLLGFNIGLIDRGLLNDFTYVGGYLLSLFTYFRIIRFFLNAIVKD